jgi:hypothetical protein
MKARRLISFLLAVWSLSPQSSVNGCSVVMGYVRPTNYELVKEADSVVLARAEAFEKKGKLRGGKSFGVFKFRVLESIKGGCKDEFISLEGDDDVRSWGDPNDFSFTKPDHGPCNPTDYKLKGYYVLFLRDWKGQWLIGGSPFTRVNVQVEGTNAPWVRAVCQYSTAAGLNDYEKEKDALLQLRSRALSGDPEVPRALATDIDAHFQKPTPAKTFSDLRALYDKPASAETREYVLWACANGAKQDAKDFVAALLRSGDWTNFISPVCIYVARVRLSGFHEKFVSALQTNHNEHERRMLLVALAGSAGRPEQAVMQGVLESVSSDELVIAAKWFEENPSKEAIDYISRVASIDYYKHSELACVLAKTGDSNVVNWAREYVKKPGEGAWLGYYVFAQSPLPAADTLAREVIKRGDSEGLIWLVQGYEDSKRTDRLERLQEITKIKTKSHKLIFWLRRTLGDWAHHGDTQAESLLSQLPVIENE